MSSEPKKRTNSKSAPRASASSSRSATKSAPIRRAPTHEDISARAYEIYLERNGEGGDPHQDWLRAEQELSSDTAQK